MGIFDGPPPQSAPAQGGMFAGPPPAAPPPAAPAPAPKPAPAAPQTRAQVAQQPQDPNGFTNFLKSAGDSAQAFIMGATDAATFGYGDEAAAGINAGLNKVTGGAMGAPYDVALGRIHGYTQPLAEQNPVASGAGELLGMAGTGAGAVRGMEAAAAKGVPLAARAVKAITPVAGEGRLANTARMAKAGAGFSAADEAIRNGGVDASTGVAALAGAAGGVALGFAAPAVIKLGQKGLNMFGELVGSRTAVDSVTAKSNAAFASILKKLDPEAAQRVVDQLNRRTGAAGSVAMALPPEVQGAVREAAMNNPVLAERLQGASALMESQKPKLLGGLVEDVAGPRNPPRPAPVPPNPQNAPAGAGSPQQPLWADMQRTPGRDRLGTQDINALETKRTDMMNKAMDPIRNKPVTLGPQDLDLFTDPDIQGFLKSLPSDTRRRLYKTLSAIDEHKIDLPVPLQVLEDIRYRAAQAGGTQDRVVAEKFKNLADEVGTIAEAQIPEYGTALQQFRENSDYIRGWEHGRAGGTEGSASGGLLRSTMDTEAGKAGLAAGRAGRLADTAISSEGGANATLKGLTENSGLVDEAKATLGAAKTGKLTSAAASIKGASESLQGAAPPRVEGPGSPMSKDLAMATGEAATGQMWSAARSVGRALDKMFGKSIMDDAVQKRVGVMLTSTNPNVVTQGLNILRKAGATNAQIGQIQTLLAAQGGAAVARVVEPTRR